MPCEKCVRELVDGPDMSPQELYAMLLYWHQYCSCAKATTSLDQSDSDVSLNFAR
ncbi:MAG: hypothetical protein ABEN55_13385 [Bradymonadaceae bacterium]